MGRGFRIPRAGRWNRPYWSDDVRAKLDVSRAKAASAGSQPNFGVSLHLIVRDSDAEAWTAADKLISRLPEHSIAAAQTKFTEQSDSVGQQRMTRLHGGRRGSADLARIEAEILQHRLNEEPAEPDWTG